MGFEEEFHIGGRGEIEFGDLGDADVGTALGARALDEVGGAEEAGSAGDDEYVCRRGS
jgi:hypothetical protein